MEPPGWDKSRAHRLLLRRGRQRSDTATIPTYEETATHGAAGAFDPATATMRLTDLLLQLHEGVPSVGPDRNEFAQNLAQAITKLIEEKQNVISQSVNSPSPNLPQPAMASPRATSPRMPRKSSRPEASGPPEDFCLDDILHEPDAAQAFHNFLAKSYCSENLEFYEVVDDFHHSYPNDAETLVLAERKAMVDCVLQIWRQYLAPAAKMQVNVDAEVLCSIEQQLESPCSTIFNEAQDAVKALMMDGWFGRFLRSNEFRVTRNRAESELAQVQTEIEHEHAQIRKWLKKVACSERAMQRLRERRRELECQAAPPLPAPTATHATLKHSTLSITPTLSVTGPSPSSSPSPSPPSPSSPLAALCSSPPPDDQRSSSPPQSFSFLVPSVQTTSDSSDPPSSSSSSSSSSFPSVAPTPPTASASSPSSSSLSSSSPSLSLSSSLSPAFSSSPAVSPVSLTASSSLSGVPPPPPRPVGPRHAKKSSWNTMLPHSLASVTKFDKRSKSNEQIGGKKVVATLRFWHKESTGDCLLVVGVVQAKQLVPREKEAGLNAYVVVKCGRQKFQTSVAALGDRNPRWREHFVFPVGKEDEGNKVSITVRNHSVLGRQTLGCLKFASPRVFNNKSDHWWTLEPRKDGDVVTGKLRLQTHYRLQGTKEKELRRSLKQVNRSIGEEEIEVIKEEQWKKKRQANALGSQDDSDAPTETAKDKSLRGPLIRGRRRSEVLTVPTSVAGVAGSTVPANKALRNLCERRTKLEKELLDLERAKEREREEEANACTEQPAQNQAVLEAYTLVCELPEEDPRLHYSN